jgi:hypothetical protein
MKEVQIATSWLGWDAWWTTYLVKFRIDPNSLESFVKLRNLKPYDRDSDERGTDILPHPKWFTKPIRKGKMGEIDVDFIEAKEDGGIYIYVDTSDENSFIVYMYGSLPPWQG